MPETLAAGIIGCGNISEIYLRNGARFGGTRLAACADLDARRSAEKAAAHGIRALSVDELLTDSEISLVINLTLPLAHEEVSLAALRAGRHLYSEKPLAVTRKGGQAILAEAAARGLRVGCAPDTFLGAGLQTCRRLLDSGAIGAPVAATAFMHCHGHERWHPDPAFFYQPGGGPLFDMGPYYLTALISLLGPVSRVTSSARISFPERSITSQPRRGETIQVKVPTHVAAVLDFASGAVATLVTSFDVWSSEAPRLEVYGSEGTLSLPDPNTFGGPVRLRRAAEKEWEERPLAATWTDNCRGLGAADMARGILEGRPHRASGDLAYHVLDVMQGIHESSVSGRHYAPETAPPRPDPLE